MARLLPTMLVLLLAVTFTANSRAMAEDAAEDEDESADTSGGDDDDDDDDKTDSGVTLRAMFPSHPQVDAAQPRFGAGEPVETLIGFDLSGDAQPQHVEFVRAHLESIAQPGYIMQNMTGTLFNRTVERGETATLVYKFTPAKEIEPRDYTMVVQVWFHEDGGEQEERQTLAAFNGTVTIADVQATVDLQAFGMVIVLGTIAAVMWKLHDKRAKRRPAAAVREKSVGAASPTVGSPAGTRNAAVDEDFIPKEHLLARKRSSSGGVRSPDGRRAGRK